MDQRHHFSSGPVSSFFMSQPVNPSGFGSSSLSTASPYSSFFGSASTKSQTVSYQPHSPSPFGGSSASSSFSSTRSSFPSSSASSSFYSSGDQSFSNASSSFSSASSPFSSASPTLSPFASNSTSGFGSGNSSCAPSTSPTSTASRLKHWKNRDSIRESPAHQMKSRRDELVAKFRGIDLSNDFALEDDPGENDPAWSWDSMCNQDWDLTKSKPEETIPWYVFDETLTWDQFLELSERDRIASGKSKPFSPPLRNEMMREIDEETIDEKEADPWLVKTEILIEPLINISDPNIMLCAYCKQYALQKTGPVKLSCSNCENYHEVKPGVTVHMLKQRMLEALNLHKANCHANFSNYTISSGDIVLICDICNKSYNISKDYQLITS